MLQNYKNNLECASSNINFPKKKSYPPPEVTFLSDGCGGSQSFCPSPARAWTNPPTFPQGKYRREGGFTPGTAFTLNRLKIKKAE
jgi:hypothetical protein